jgi:hypothetical protein
MINPDTENLILISNDELVQIEIENVMRVRNENQILKTSILVIIVLTIIIITNYNTKIQDERNKKHL